MLDSGIHFFVKAKVVTAFRYDNSCVVLSVVYLICRILPRVLEETEAFLRFLLLSFV